MSLKVSRCTWVTCDKNRNFHLTHGTHPLRICKTSPITKVQYPLEFCKKKTSETTLNPLKIYHCWKNPAREKKNIPEKILTFLPEKKKINPEKKIENVPEKTSNCPRKILRKWARKTISAREKNQKKYQKPFSRALFIFSGKKKNTARISTNRIYNEHINFLAKLL